MDRLGQLVRAVEAGRAVDLVNARGSAAIRAAVEVQARTGRRIVWIAPDVGEARRALADLVHLDALVRGTEPDEGVLDRPEGGERLLLLPPHLHSPYGDVVPDRARQQARMTSLFRLALDFPWAYLVIAAQSLATRIPDPGSIAARTDMIRRGMEVERERLVALIETCGYHRLAVVEVEGTYAVRGDIVDIWPPSMTAPVRIEMLWSEVDRMRLFDPASQRTMREVDEVFIHPVVEIPADQASRDEAARRVLDLCDAQDVPTRKARQIADEIRSRRTVFGLRRFFPAFHERMPSILDAAGDAIVFVENPAEVTATAQRAASGIRRDFETLRASGEPAFPPEDFLAEPDPGSRPVLVHPPPSPPEPGGEIVDLAAADHREIALAMHRGEGTARVGTLRPLVLRIGEWIEQGMAVTLAASTEAGTERLLDLLSGYGLDPGTEPGTRPRIARGPLTRGCVLPDAGEVFLSEQEVFGPRIRRRRAPRAEPRPEDDLRTLQPGDHVVHKVHGVGRFEGLVRREHDGLMLELIKVLYRDGDVLYVPVYSLDQIQKFVGGAPQRLDKLGGESFARVKERTSRAVADLADRLLGLYATRQAALRARIPPRDRDFREFEALFPYEETPDQERAIEDVMQDLERDRPMDRLVCGDVGFGKTEVAVRAAYRVASSGRQVAVLVPTTILAQQHLATFRQRLSSTPLRVEALSRFQPPAEKRGIIADLKKGAVDIVIGTHRLLSRDVHFADLGLLVIDEEHRFGVSQKERIKFLSPSTDVLHMTATPIPRTLQMSLGDILDLSLIASAPVERLSVTTHVVRKNDAIVREAILGEISRGGQVFFVHNRVETIGKAAGRLAEIVPEARMAVAHGQMASPDLEKVMLDFVSGRVDVLVCTSIIESGLDIPNANTLVVDDAHAFGLAQLYQIRGRVGRSSAQAHAYLVVPPAGRMTAEAAERIDTLVRFASLGSGFHVATMDLEIRGAGDLLGAEQSGHVRAVGFDLYCEMLRRAVERLRGEEPIREPEPELSLDVAGYIPEEYVDDPGLRLTLYKRMASARAEREVEETIDEMRDRFGPLPGEVEALGRIMALKVLLRGLRAHGLEASRSRIQVHLSASSPLDPARLADLVQASGGLTRLTPEMKLIHRYDEKGETLDLARRFVESVLDLVSPDA